MTKQSKYPITVLCIAFCTEDWETAEEMKLKNSLDAESLRVMDGVGTLGTATFALV